MAKTTDPLTGKFLISYTAEDTIEYVGQIGRRLREHLYLVKYANAMTHVLTGAIVLDKEVMQRMDSMTGWEFFESREDCQQRYGEYVRRQELHG